MKLCYDGRSFERTTSSTLKMTQHHYEQLIIKRGHQNHAWDKGYAENYSMYDLDHDEIWRGLYDLAASQVTKKYQVT